MMTSAAPSPTPAAHTHPAPAPPTLTEHLLHAWLMTGFGLLLLAATIRDYRLVQEFSFLRTDCLVAAMYAGLGIAFCFGGAMHYLDLALVSRTIHGTPIRWYWRIVFLSHKRLLMLGQLAAAALVVAVLGIMIFQVEIPSRDQSVISRGWIAPDTEP